MLGYLILAMIAGTICTGGSLIAIGQDPLEVFDSSDSVSLSAIGYYEDGGTVSFILVNAQGDTLRGGFDGRIREGNSCHPYHCYIGDTYPTKPRCAFSASLGG